jgi:hypothetical protein
MYMSIIPRIAFGSRGSAALPKAADRSERVATGLIHDRQPRSWAAGWSSGRYGLDAVFAGASKICSASRAPSILRGTGQHLTGDWRAERQAARQADLHMTWLAAQVHMATEHAVLPLAGCLVLACGVCGTCW